MTRSEMLACWRRALAIDPTPAGCTVAMFEGIDTDAVIGHHMRQWYLRLLDTADPALLPVDDIARDTTLAAAADSATVILPADVRRVVDIRLQGWARAVAPLARDSPEAVRRLARMASPYARPGAGEPLAVQLPGRLFVAPVDMPVISSLRVIRDPGPDTYILDESLLSTIPTQPLL